MADPQDDLPANGLSSYVFDPSFDQPPVDEPRLIYLIASQARTGSNLLCALLSRSGVAGVPTEYLHRQLSRAAVEERGFGDVDAYLRDVMRRRTTPNGVFGLKAHYEQFADFLRVTRARLPQPLRVVRLIRRDVVAQAISYYIALRTGRWSGTDRGKGHAAELAYDFDAISRSVGIVLKERNDWTLLFRRRGVEPRALAYETLTEDPVAACRHVLDWLGIPAAGAPIDARDAPQRQGTQRNAEWAARFRAEAAARGLPPP